MCPLQQSAPEEPDVTPCLLHPPGSAYTWCPYCPTFFEEALAVVRRRLGLPEPPRTRR